ARPVRERRSDTPKVPRPTTLGRSRFFLPSDHGGNGSPRRAAGGASHWSRARPLDAFYAQRIHGFIVSDVGAIKELSAGTMLDPAYSAAFVARLDEIARDVENLLDRLLASGAEAIEISRPRRLLDAMRYGSLGGGKRLRPFLVAESAALFGVPLGNALMAGAALE